MPTARIPNASAVENDQPAPKQAEFGLDLGGGATGYRLTVGPLPNSAAATGLCAHFAAARTACRAVKFEGEQIAQQ